MSRNGIDKVILTDPNCQQLELTPDGEVPVEIGDALPESFKSVSSQYPLPTDTDSVYAKDIDNINSITIDWLDIDATGEPIAEIPFINLFTRIQNATINNPKILTIYFTRTVLASSIGLGANIAGSFSNVKIVLIGSGGAERSEVDESADPTIYTSRVYKFKEDIYFNAVRFEFHTANTITLSNITTQKTTRVSVSQVETTTNSLKVMDYSHAELHSGDHYVYGTYNLIAKAGTKDYLIITPNTPRWSHMTIGIDPAVSEFVFGIYEDATVSANGILTPSINRNRNFPDDNTTLIYEDPVVLTVGTLLRDRYLGSGKNLPGGASRDSEEILLEQNTIYLVRTTEQNINPSNVSIDFDWYEHTNLTG